MPKDTERATPVNEAAVPKASTNWAAFEKAGLAPREIWCQMFKPVHAVDYSCHSRVLLKGENIANHINSDHGGGFIMNLRPTEKTWPGWKELSERGIEAHVLICGVCEHSVMFHPQHLLTHMKPHLNGNRRRVDGGEFRFALSFDKPLPENEEFE